MPAIGIEIEKLPQDVIVKTGTIWLFFIGLLVAANIVFSIVAVQLVTRPQSDSVAALIVIGFAWIPLFGMTIVAIFTTDRQRLQFSKDGVEVRKKSLYAQKTWRSPYAEYKAVVYGNGAVPWTYSGAVTYRQFIYLRHSDVSKAILLSSRASLSELDLEPACKRAEHYGRLFGLPLERIARPAHLRRGGGA